MSKMSFRRDFSWASLHVAGFLLAVAPGLGAVGQEPGRVLPARQAVADDKDLPKVVTDNKNTLVKAHREKLKATASSFWPGWEPEKVIDGDVETSWFSERGDAAAKGKKPWVTITFPEDLDVTRVTIVGNREPSWFEGYTILTGMVEFLDADGKQLWVEENEGVGNRRDFEFKPKKAVKKVRAVKFTSLKDQGDQNPYDDIAIAEFMIE